MEEEVGELDTRTIMEKISENRIAVSEHWCEELGAIIHEAVENEKKDIMTEWANKEKNRKNDLLDGLARRYAVLKEDNAREIDSYVRAHPEIKPDIDELEKLCDKQRATSTPKKSRRGHRSQQNKDSNTTLDSFNQDYGIALTEIEANGTQVNEMTLIADNAAYHNGNVFCKADPIYIKTRFKKDMKAKIDNVSKAEITVQFDDTSLLSLHYEDLASGRVSIMPA